MPSFRRQAPRCLALIAIVALAACGANTSVSLPDSDADRVGLSDLPTQLAFTSVLGRSSVHDSAHVVGAPGSLAVTGLLNQTPPCFSLASGATRDGDHIIVHLIAREVETACATFVAGAFDYDVRVSGVTSGTYYVDVVHRTLFRDGRTGEQQISRSHVEVH
jgi:predicted small lipoprotein YifL